MAITTTENINVSNPTKCWKCGWTDGLMVLNPNGLPVHFDDCPKGKPPKEPETLIGHDPLNRGEKALAKALAHLREQQTIERAVRNDHGESVEVIAEYEGETVEVSAARGEVWARESRKPDASSAPDLNAPADGTGNY